MRASVVIPSRNEGPVLAKTVHACLDTTGALDCEIVVANDASDDESVDRVRDEFPHVRVVSHAARRGVSLTKDLGARSSSGDVLVFLDGHCKPEPGAIARLVADVEELEGRVVVTPGVAALDVGRWSNEPERVGHGYRIDLETLDARWTDLESLRPRGHARLSTLYRQPTICGCVAAMSRTLYDTVWGFDTGMQSYGWEDVDFGVKAWLMGYEVLHDTEPVVGHRFRSAADGEEFAAHHPLANQLRMARKSFTDAVWFDWLQRCASRHDPLLWAPAWAEFLGGYESIERERAYLMGHRRYDEFWYAREFGCGWPAASGNGSALHAAGGVAQVAFAQRNGGTSHGHDPATGLDPSWTPVNPRGSRPRNVTDPPFTSTPKPPDKFKGSPYEVAKPLANAPLAHAQHAGARPGPRFTDPPPGRSPFPPQGSVRLSDSTQGRPQVSPPAGQTDQGPGGPALGGIKARDHDRPGATRPAEEDSPTNGHPARPRPATVRLLVAVANYGSARDDCVRALVDRYHAMSFESRVIVFSDAQKPLPDGARLAVGLPSSDPETLPFAHKRLFADEADQYDLFVYSEDDLRISEENLRAFLEAAEHLPDGEVAGFVRYEVDPAGGIRFPDAHPPYGWVAGSVRAAGPFVFASFSNDHSGCYALTRGQLKRALRSGGYLVPPHASWYGLRESAATDPYTRCGLSRRICVSHLDRFLVHHLFPNSAGIAGTDERAFREQVAGLLGGR
jgi:glycosyltransferase involved in cell wall biosynthesis